MQNVWNRAGFGAAIKNFMKKLRIGFLSTANIGKKNWKAIYNSGNAIVTAVASRDVDKSRQFIDECQRENLPLRKNHWHWAAMKNCSR